MVKRKINKRISKHLIKKKVKTNKVDEKNIKQNSSKSNTIAIRKKIKLIKNRSTSLDKINNYNSEKEIKNIVLNHQDDILQNEFKEEEDKFYTMRCYDCSYIPLIKIKYADLNLLQNQETFLEKHKDIVSVELFCSKGHIISTPLKQYLINCGINHNFISLCGICHQNKPNELFNFSFCKICKKTLCLECSSNHHHSPPDDNDFSLISERKNINLISIAQLDFNCQYHNKDFFSFCKECNVNICKDCESFHINHKMIILDDIKLSNEEKTTIQSNINLAKKRLILFNIKILKFIQSLHKLEKLYLQLLTLYNDFISIYKEQISFSQMLLSIYNNASLKNKYNYQIIQNVRNLKFNIRGIPIKNSSDFTTNIKSLTSYLTNNKNYLLIDIKNYYGSKKILKARVRAAAKRIRSKIYLNNKTNKKNNDVNKP